MTKEESRADHLLSESKETLREAWRSLDPSPADPISHEILRAMDAVDAARKILKDRP